MSAWRRLCAGILTVTCIYHTGHQTVML